MASPAVRVEGVAKKYCRRLRHTMLYGVTDLMHAFVGATPGTERLRRGEFWAVENVAFEVQPGECIGLVGPNGSGKSTLLKLVGGVFMPDRGRVTVRGRLGALIEVGAGFHPMLTGRENIYVYGSIMGMTRREIAERFDEIVEFSGVRDWLDTPLKFYSSGMHVRLGFAVAAHVEPSVLLVDEVLAVGDAEFQARCYGRLAKMLKAGTAVILVSHNLLDIQRLCTQCLWLRDGQVAAAGAVMDVLTAYTQYVDQLTLSQRSTLPEEPPRLSPQRKAAFSGLSFLDGAGMVRPEATFLSGETMRVRLRFATQDPQLPVTFTFSFRSGDGAVYSAYCSAYDGFVLAAPSCQGAVELVFPQLLLSSGVYSVNVGLWDGSYIGAYDWYWDTARFTVRSESPMNGRFLLPHQWKAVAESEGPA